MFVLCDLKDILFGELLKKGYYEQHSNNDFIPQKIKPVQQNDRDHPHFLIF